MKKEEQDLIEKAYNEFNFQSKSKQMNNEDYKNLLKFAAKYFADKILTNDSKKLYNDLYDDFYQNLDSAIH